MRSNTLPGSRLPASGLLLAVGPAAVLLVWFAAGQWDAAGPNVHSWLRLAGTLSLAALLPLPGRSSSIADVGARLRRWGWITVLGLIAIS